MATAILKIIDRPDGSVKLEISYDHAEPERQTPAELLCQSVFDRLVGPELAMERRMEAAGRGVPVEKGRRQPMLLERIFGFFNWIPV